MSQEDIGEEGSYSEVKAAYGRLCAEVKLRILDQPETRTDLGVYDGARKSKANLHNLHTGEHLVTPELPLVPAEETGIISLLLIRR